jgi:hypothetical protein
MEALVAAGRLRAPKAVLDELTRIDDACCKWAKAQQNLFTGEHQDPWGVWRRPAGER